MQPCDRISHDHGLEPWRLMVVESVCNIREILADWIKSAKQVQAARPFGLGSAHVQPANGRVVRSFGGAGQRMWAPVKVRAGNLGTRGPQGGTNARDPGRSQEQGDGVHGLDRDRPR